MLPYMAASMSNIVPGVKIGLAFDQDLYGVVVVVKDSVHQGCPAVRALFVEISAA